VESVSQVKLDFRGPMEVLGQPERLDLMVKLEQVGLQDQTDLLDPMGNQEPLETMVQRDNQDPRDQLEQLEDQVQ